MKKFLFLLLFFTVLIVKAQVNGNYEIKWNNTTNWSSDLIHYKVPQFDIKNFYFDAQNRQISFMANLQTSSYLDEASIEIHNMVFEQVSAQQLGDLDVKLIASSVKAKVTNSKARNKISATLVLNPIIKDGSGFKRLKSFSYSVKPQSTVNSYARKKSSAIEHSVLASGDWYRFYVVKSGVYKVSKSFLQQLGMDLKNADPRNIRLYGNGGRMVPLLNSVNYPTDLTENAIQFIGEEDGVFDNEDYILFYAEGLDNWSAENLTHNNLYSDKSYYYVTLTSSPGKRITTAIPPTGGGTPTTISIFDDYQFHEQDLTNIAKLGRKWFGEQFQVDNEQTFTFNIPNIVTTQPVSINVAGAAVAFTQTRLQIAANNNVLGNIYFGALVQNSGIEGTEGSFSSTFTGSENVTVDLKYDNGGVPSANGYLDYIILQSKRNLKGYGKQFRFRYNQAANIGGVGQFQMTNASSVGQVWDITDIYNVSRYINNAQDNFSFLANLGEVRNYIAIDNQDIYSPIRDSQSKVVNQDLKGTVFNNNQGAFQDLDYLIITPSFLHGSAEKLANYHQTNSGLNVKVVNLEDIYQEFSSGKQDIGSIRNFVRYVYENASSPDKKLKYLNLFGDASFDFKNRIPNNTNIVPIYHTLSSFSLSGSYSTDDFFVLLDDNEGDMTSNNANGLDVAVGRMIIDSAPQADQMVNKVFEYVDSKSFGRWRNNIVLMADDVDKEGEDTLEKGLDALSQTIATQKPALNIGKIYSDAYVQEASSGGNRYPQVRTDIVNTFGQGALVFDYFGHGGEDGLASERIFETPDAQNLSNKYKYPLFVTITCQFTRFDNPYKQTCGEFMYWNPAGGAVSLVTTTREIGIGTGQDINEAFAANLFGFGTNEQYSIAEALRMSKAGYAGTALMVSYIGDPALKLAMPIPKIVLTKVNDVSTSQPVDTFKALSTIKLSGEIRDENGNILLSDYNGDLSVNIFDKMISRSTLGNDGIRDSSGNLITMTFNTLGETIFRGNASVKNGLFEFSFVVPKDIRVPVGNGRISFYATQNGQMIDKSGYDESILVGGINENAVADTQAPLVKLYMNDQSFVSGGITNSSPIFLAFLSDNSGINTASGIGHDIVAILDGDESHPYILNDYYQTETDNYKKGEVSFPFSNLSPGLHTITFKAWDVYNNPVTAEIQFLVVGDDEIVLKNVLNYPNPFVSYTQFWFTHNKPFEPLEVQIQVMTVTGKVVWTKNQLITTEGFLSRDITWDGRDDFGDRIGKGVYVYKLTVKSTLSHKKAEKFEKLVIL